MPLSMFKGLKKDTVRRSSSRSDKWLINKIKSLGKEGAVSRPALGDMFLYSYSAKHKETLPFWDANPLIIMIAKAKGGWWGLNLHYLPPKLRIMFLEAILKSTAGKIGEREKDIGRATVLARATKSKFTAPMVHRYLTGQVKSRLVKIPQEEWFNVADLAVANWKKSSAGKVYSSSRRKL